MARPPKIRRVCLLPEHNTFAPVHEGQAILTREPVVITIVEYECMRLMDYEGLNQTETAEAMGVARSSVQRTYEQVRVKMAECMIEGRPLHVKGGDYRLCEDMKDLPRCRNCHGQRRRRGRNRK